MLDGGIEPPVQPGLHAAWIAWWDATSSDWTDQQREHVWQALDRLRFFDLMEEAPSTKMYLVVEIGWSWNDNPFLDADSEGGAPVGAFRSREKAQAECDRRNEERRSQGEFRGRTTFDYREREGNPEAIGDWTQLDAHEAIFFEVLEVEAEVGS